LFKVPPATNEAMLIIEPEPTVRSKPAVFSISEPPLIEPPALEVMQEVGPSVRLFAIKTEPPFTASEPPKVIVPKESDEPLPTKKEPVKLANVAAALTTSEPLATRVPVPLKSPVKILLPAFRIPLLVIIPPPTDPTFVVAALPSVRLPPVIRPSVLTPLPEMLSAPPLREPPTVAFPATLTVPAEIPPKRSASFAKLVTPFPSKEVTLTVPLFALKANPAEFVTLLKEPAATENTTDPADTIKSLFPASGELTVNVPPLLTIAPLNKFNVPPKFRFPVVVKEPPPTSVPTKVPVVTLNAPELTIEPLVSVPTVAATVEPTFRVPPLTLVRELFSPCKVRLPPFNVVM